VTFRIPVWALFAVVAATVASPLRAQSPGTIEAGLFGQRTAFDEQTGLTFGTAPGFGGSLGVFVLTDLALEIGSAYTWTSASDPSAGSATWVPLRIGAAYHFPLTDDIYPLVGAGLVRNSYSGAVDGSDTGLSALVGIKTYLSEKVAFRSDLRLDAISDAFDGVSSHSNWSFTAGISMDFGKGRYRDTDGDGVRNRQDLCPATVPGVRVGSEGCRLDEDGDGVFEEEDLCPMTPRGVGVDSTGCRLDGDADRVFDEDDQCPATPESIAVDALGCPLDTDADQVLDYLDACPATPLGVSVDTRGCPLDTDGDRVVDQQDICPGTPVGVGVDATGCRLDSDMDGVWDEDDRCSDHAPGVTVGPDGCPVLFEEEQDVLVLREVTFESWSAELTPEAQHVLNEIAEALVVRPDVHIRVNGHTDSDGTRELNLSLSQARADAVRDYLISRGVPGDQLEARGFGPDAPIATNETPDGRRQNRRVELERINLGGA
jgi:outer membrane protein OmpA-like peptidoglycan-associated protein